jgi:Cytochrome P460
MKMLAWIVRAAVIVSPLLFFCLMPTTASTSLVLPSSLADYRTWSPLMTEPKPVPLALWLKCSVTTKDDIAAAYKAHGPHAERYVRVYANPSAMETLRHSASRTFPSGAIIAKEKLTSASDLAPNGVAFMVKRDGPAFRDTGGWEFQYYPTRGPTHQIHEACAACHRAAASKGYVLGEYAK